MARKTYLEPARQLEVVAQPDVLVVGGGLSGVSAALAAARAGARTLLVERNASLGGVATAGLMANIGNRYFTGDNQQVVRGIASELVKRLVEKGGASHYSCPPNQCFVASSIPMDPEVFKWVIVETLEEANVEVLLLSYSCAAIVEDGTLKGVIVENAGGRQVIEAKATVDASSDADVAYRAGAPCQAVLGSASLLFRMAYVDMDEFVDYFRQNSEHFPDGRDHMANAEEMTKMWDERGLFKFPHGGGRLSPLFQQYVESGEYQTEVGDARNLDAFGMYGYKGHGVVTINSNFFQATLDPWQRSRNEMQAQRVVYHAARFLRKHIPGFEEAEVVSMAQEIGLRTTRRIEGRETLTAENLKNHTRFDNVVGVVGFVGKVKGEAVPSGWADIPYSCLLPKRVANLVVGSGKTLSTDPRGIVRGMSRCMTVGQAAGVAASLSAQQGVAPHQLDVRSLQRALLGQGVFLGDQERLVELGLA